ncbi:MAG: RNA polymerase sigma-70 factor [Bacteroidales bacterium]|nr:RNA polymerase sigma-70 factor [Bacteroidales bacterium]
MATDDRILKTEFEKLFREHFTTLCYFARKYLGDLDSSKEIVHSVFIKLWENRLEFDWEKPAKSYLFTAVYNRSMNFIRDNRKFVSEDPATIREEVNNPSAFSDTMEVAELEGRIKKALQRLPEKCREVFELNRFEGKKYAEIATYLNISVKTVETQMSKALKVLKEELRDYLYVFILFLLNTTYAIEAPITIGTNYCISWVNPELANLCFSNCYV